MGRDPDEIVRVIHSDLHLLRKQFATLDSSPYVTASNKLATENESGADRNNREASSPIESPKKTKHSQLEVICIRFHELKI